MTSITISPGQPIDGDNVMVNATTKNIGLQTADNYIVQIFYDSNSDSVSEAGEIIFEEQFSNLSAGDSIIATASMTSLSSKNYNIIAKVIYSSDEDTSNNSKYFSFTVTPPGNNYNDVVINEIMYAPSVR